MARRGEGGAGMSLGNMPFNEKYERHLDDAAED